MTIREITDDTIVQTCEACGKTRTVELTALSIGVVHENHINDSVVPMPACSQCGATEYLIPSEQDAPEHPSPGSFGHRHAILVDVLHERLAQRGRVAKGLDVSKLKKKKRTEQEINSWFKDGLKLAEPVSPESSNDKKTKTNEEKSDVR